MGPESRRGEASYLIYPHVPDCFCIMWRYNSEHMEPHMESSVPGTGNPEHPRSYEIPKSSPYLYCKQNCGVLSTLVGFTVAAKLWRVNQRQSSGSCDRTSGASPAILSHHIQSAFYTSCVHKGGTYPGPPQPLAFTPLSLPLVLPPHASVPTRSTWTCLVSWTRVNLCASTGDQDDTQRGRDLQIALVSPPASSSSLKSISPVVSELRRPHVLHLSPAAPSVKRYVSSGCAFTEAWRPHTAHANPKIRVNKPEETSRQHVWTENNTGWVK